MNKMFALVNVEEADSVNLKCDPEKAIELRVRFMGVQQGCHMSKKHWNTVSFASDVNRPLLIELIDHSYHLVVSKLTKKEKQALSEL